MKSLVCKLDGTSHATAAALAEAETFAIHSNLTEKQALHLRLLTEELLGMASGLLEVRNGTFWIEQEGVCYQLHLSARADVGEQARSRLLDASTTGTDELHKGIKGKIRQALEWMILPSAGGAMAPIGMYGTAGLHGSMTAVLPRPESLEWSLECYRQSIAQEDKAMAWDELEKSVLGKLANDIRVGVRSDLVEITIEKTF